jgi:hypothetical protein
MTSFFAVHGAGDLLSRYSFIEPLLAGRRALEIGAARRTEGASALLLAERGAAAVVSVEEEADGVARAVEAVHHPFVQFRAGGLGDLPKKAFDLVLVADGAPLAASPERLAALAELLTPNGHLVTSLAAAGARGLAALAGEPLASDVPSYESFAGALAAQFDVVEIATQAPAVGWVLAPASREGAELELGIDGTLAGAPEAAFYVAVCGAQPSRLGGMVLVTLPHAELAEAALAAGASARAHAGCAGAVGARDAELARLAAALAEAEDRIAARDGALAGVREELDAERALSRASEADAAREAAAAAREEAAEARAVDAETDLDDLRAALDDAREALDAAREALLAAELRAGEDEGQLLAARADLEALAAELAAAMEARADVAAVRAEGLGELFR